MKHLLAQIEIALDMKPGETTEQAARRLYDLMFDKLCGAAGHKVDFWVDDISARE